MNTNGRVSRVRLGDDLVVYCGRCKEERNHQIVALSSEGRAERVQCRTCGSNRLYREKKNGAGEGARQRRERTPKAGVINPNFNKPARVYSPQEKYIPGEVIAHGKFGTGEVMGSRGGKIDVRFGSEMRTLLHAR
ncbi:MAG: hypothetical protein M3430_00355 [Acidobacteriota bacterium]|nr:hypothetical protein [Acidobacteriota bacterium]